MRPLAALALALAVLAAPARAALGPAQRLAGGVARPVAGIGADGAAVVAWIGFEGRVDISVRPVDGRFGKAHPLLGSEDAREVAIATNATGATIVAWRRGSGARSSIRYATGDAGGAIGHTQTLRGSAGALDVHVGLADDRTAVFVWSGLGRGTRRLVRASVGGRLKTIEGCCHSPTRLALSVAADGSALAAWLARDGAQQRVEVALRGARQAQFGAVGHLRAPMAPASVRPAVAAGPDGNAIVVWRTTEGHDVDGARGPVVAAGRSGGHGFAAGVPISASSRIAGAPAVALGASDVAIATWLQGPVGRYSAVSAVRAAGAGSPFGAAEVLGPAAYDASRTDPQVATTEDGRAIAAWGFPGQANFGILAAGRPVAGPWSAAQQLSGGGYASRVALAGAYSGRAVAAWTEDTPARRGGVFAAVGTAG